MYDVDEEDNEDEERVLLGGEWIEDFYFHAETDMLSLMDTLQELSEVQEDGGVLPPTEKQIRRLLTSIDEVEGLLSWLREEIQEHSPRRLELMTVGHEPEPQK